MQQLSVSLSHSQAHLDDEVRDAESFANGALGTNALAEATIRAIAAAHFMMLVGLVASRVVCSSCRQEGSNNHVMGRGRG